MSLPFQITIAPAGDGVVAVIETPGYLLVYEQGGELKMLGSLDPQALLKLVGPLVKDAILAQSPFKR